MVFGKIIVIFQVQLKIHLLIILVSVRFTFQVFSMQLVPMVGKPMDFTQFKSLKLTKRDSGNLKNAAAKCTYKRMQSDQNVRLVPFSAVYIIPSSVRCGSHALSVRIVVAWIHLINLQLWR